MVPIGGTTRAALQWLSHTVQIMLFALSTETFLRMFSLKACRKSVFSNALGTFPEVTFHCPWCSYYHCFHTLFRRFGHSCLILGSGIIILVTVILVSLAFLSASWSRYCHCRHWNSLRFGYSLLITICNGSVDLVVWTSS